MTISELKQLEIQIDAEIMKIRYEADLEAIESKARILKKQMLNIERKEKLKKLSK